MTLERSGGGGGIPPPEEFIRSSGAPWRIGRVLVAPPTDKSRTSTVQIRASFFLNHAKMAYYIVGAEEEEGGIPPVKWCPHGG